MTQPTDEEAWKALFREMDNEDQTERAHKLAMKLLEFHEIMLNLKKDNKKLQGTVEILYKSLENSNTLAKRYKSERDSAIAEGQTAIMFMERNYEWAQRYKADRNTYRKHYEEVWEEQYGENGRKRHAPTTGTPELPRKK
jgi:hypothetical protein